TPSYDDGSITLNPVVTSDYIRGDANSDERVNIADGIWIIAELFLGGEASTCPIARDSNNDGQVDAADAVYIFQYRFLDGPQPEAPFPSCGQTDGQTPEDCSSSGCGGGGSAPVTFANDIQPILTAACAPCHTPGGAQGNGPSAGLQLTENAYGNLVDVPAGQCDQLNLVHSGDRASSWLYRKVVGSHTEADVLDIGCCPDTDGDGAPDGCGRRMPRFCENSQSCLDEATLELIGTWIDEGAL
ncbi:MAG: dockerin type I domain-containing protein, partial [Planctomycetota bacterium]